MKLLFGQNLPPRLVRALEDVFPGSAHVAMVELDRASDLFVDPVAGAAGLHLFTFNQLKQTANWRRELLGSPPP